MPRELFPSSYECDCGHQSHFFERTIREAKRRSLRKRLLLGDSEPDAHVIVFSGGEMVDILCPHRNAPPDSALPETLRPLFWDYESDTLNWKEDRDLIVSRVLMEGNWEAVRWLRTQMGDRGLGEWIVSRRGRGLSPQCLRFWQLVLRLPRRQVNAWVAERKRQSWHDRVHR